MADYSFDELYAWLKQQPRHLNWGMISSMDRSKLNRLLLQAYIQRFKTSAYLPPITGSIANGSAGRFALNEFTLDWPRLSFTSTQPNDSTARLHMQVMSGTYMNLTRIGNSWEVHEISETGPLQGPVLSLDLWLDQVPGVVSGDGRLRLDLNESSDFSIPLSEDPGQRRLAGEYFRQKFEALADEQRVFPLGQIEAGSDPLLRAASFALRTQARGRDSEDEEGAVLAFVRFLGSEEGNFPGKDYRYLIPRDKAYDAAVIFQSERIMLAQLLESLKGIASNVEFELTFDDEGKLTGAVAKRGELVLPKHSHTYPFDTPPDDFGVVWHMVFKFDIEAIKLSMADELSVSMKDDLVELSWRVTGVLGVQPVSLDDTTGEIARVLEQYDFDTSAFFERSEDTFEYEFTTTYKLVDEAGGTLQFDDTTMSAVKEPAPCIGAIKPPELDPQDPRLRIAFWIIRVGEGLVFTWFDNAITNILKMVNELGYPSLEQIVNAALARSFEFSDSVRGLVSETIKLNFGNVLIGQDQFAPRDIALYGAVNPIVTAFAIEPMEHTLMAGGAPKPFATLPDQSGQLNWTCEPVLDSVSSEKIGRIDPRSGVYTPPDASDFDGAFVRLRVNAQHTQSGFRSSALITVLKRPLQINPLLYVTHAEGEVQLQAGYLGDSKDLRWSTPTYGQLNPSGLAAVYKGPATMPPLDDKSPRELAAFTVDEVVLSNSSTQQTAVLITEGGNKDLMRIRREVNAEAGTVQLTAVINDYVQDPKDVEWSLRGPGQIDCAGLYTPDKGSQEPFALITATRNTEGFGIYQGYVVQTLPPAKLEDAVLGVGAYQVRQNPSEGKS